jgi:hypothetical protein
MSGCAHAGLLMTDTFDMEALIVEIQRYLVAVDAFREAGCRLSWRRERRAAVTS